MPGIKVGSHIFDSSVHLENAIPLKWGEVILTKLHTTISGMAKWCNVVTVSNIVCNIALSVDTNLIKAIFKLMAAKNKPIIFQ